MFSCSIKILIKLKLTRRLFETVQFSIIKFLYRFLLLIHSVLLSQFYPATFSPQFIHAAVSFFYLPCHYPHPALVYNNSFYKFSYFSISYNIHPAISFRNLFSPDLNPTIMVLLQQVLIALTLYSFYNSILRFYPSCYVLLFTLFIFLLIKTAAIISLF